jgi:hypothetical protein
MNSSPMKENQENGPNLKHRMDAVTRLLRGEEAAEVARELNVPVRQVDQWAREYCRAGEMRLRQLPENWVERCLTAMEKLVPLATLVSVLLAVTLFFQGQHKEAIEQAKAAAQDRESRVRDAYTALDDKYLDYVKLCLDHPDLDVFDTPMLHPVPPTPEQHRRESMMLSTLLSILERAYLMYSTPDDAFEKKQWAAWTAYMKAWAVRTNFREEWANSRKEFDADFAAYLDNLIQTASTQPAN